MINLSWNYISNIDEHTFNFRNKNDRTLKIDLTYNKLNHDSFAVNSLSNFKGLISLDLRENQIKYFKKEVFHPFFVSNEKNILKFSGIHILMNDQRNIWFNNG